MMNCGRGFQLSVSCRVGGPACTLSAIEASKMFCGIRQGHAEISGLGWRIKIVPGNRHNTTSVVISELVALKQLRAEGQAKGWGGFFYFTEGREGKKRYLRVHVQMESARGKRSQTMPQTANKLQILLDACHFFNCARSHESKVSRSSIRHHTCFESYPAPWAPSPRQGR